MAAQLSQIEEVSLLKEGKLRSSVIVRAPNKLLGIFCTETGGPALVSMYSVGTKGIRQVMLREYTAFDVIPREPHETFEYLGSFTDDNDILRYVFEVKAL